MAPRGVAVGVDRSEELVREARRRWVAADNLMFVQGSPAEIPWRDGFFTKVVSLDPEWAQEAGEIRRVLAPGGQALMLDPPEGALALFQAAGFDPVAVREVGREPPRRLLEAGRPR